MATPIINFIKLSVTSLSVSCRDSFIRATNGALNSCSMALSKFVSWSVAGFSFFSISCDNSKEFLSFDFDLDWLLDRSLF